MSTFSLSPMTRHGSTLAGKLHDDIAVCEECSTIEHVAIGDLVRAPGLIPLHCGEPMSICSLAEIDRVREKAAKQRGASL